jgi:bacterial/archaeal transporter family protein
MAWLYLAMASGMILGLYDLLKKQSVRGNAVMPVLMISNVTCAVVWIPLVLWSAVQPDSIPVPMLVVEPISPLEHLYLWIKACIVGISWLLGYFALKHLPISIASTIGATRPVYTLLGALILFHESPNSQQWLGMAVVLVSFFALSRVGKREGIHFRSNRWVWLMLAATVAGAASGLWDKFLLSTVGLRASTVQAWFSIYLVVFMIIPFWGWLKNWWPRGQFEWRWSIPAIGIALLAADFSYFTALNDPDAMISVISCLRRSAVIVSFGVGTYLYKEKLFRRKLPCVLGILAGILIILFG